MTLFAVLSTILLLPRGCTSTSVLNIESSGADRLKQASQFTAELHRAFSPTHPSAKVEAQIHMEPNFHLRRLRVRPKCLLWQKESEMSRTSLDNT